MESFGNRPSLVRLVPSAVFKGLQQACLPMLGQGLCVIRSQVLCLVQTSVLLGLPAHPSLLSQRDGVRSLWCEILVRDRIDLVFRSGLTGLWML